MASSSTQTDFGYFRERDDTDLIIIKLIAFCLFVVCFIVYVGLFLNNIYHITFRGVGDKGKANRWTDGESGSDAILGFYTSVIIQSYVGIALIIAADVLNYYDRERYNGRLVSGTNWFTSISMIVACVVFCVQTYVFFIHPGFDDMMCGMDIPFGAHFDDNKFAIEYENKLFNRYNLNIDSDDTHQFFIDCVNVRDDFIDKINDLTTSLADSQDSEEKTQLRKELAEIKNKLYVRENVTDELNAIFNSNSKDVDNIEDYFKTSIGKHFHPRHVQVKGDRTNVHFPDKHEHAGKVMLSISKLIPQEFGFYAFYSQFLDNAPRSAVRTTIDLYNARITFGDALSSEVVSSRKAYIQHFSNHTNKLFKQNDFDSNSFDAYVDNCNSVETRYNEMHSMFSSSLFNVLYKLDKYNRDGAEAQPEENLHKRATFAHYLQSAVFFLGFFGVFGTALDYALEINEVTKRDADMGQDKNDLDKYRNAIVKHIMGSGYSWGRDSDNDGKIMRGGNEVAIKVIAGKDGPEYEIIGTDPDGIDPEKLIFAIEIIDRMMELKHFTKWRNAGGTKRVLKEQIDEWTEKFDYEMVMARKSRVDYETHKKKLDEKDEVIDSLQGTIKEKEYAAKKEREKEIEVLKLQLAEKEREAKLLQQQADATEKSWLSVFGESQGKLLKQKVEAEKGATQLKTKIKELEGKVNETEKRAANAEEKVKNADEKADQAKQELEDTKTTLDNLKTTINQINEKYEGSEKALELATQSLTKMSNKLDNLSAEKTKQSMKAEKKLYNEILNKQSKVIRDIINETYNFAGSFSDEETQTLTQVEKFVTDADTILDARGKKDKFPQTQFEKEYKKNTDNITKAKLVYIYLPWILTDRPHILPQTIAGAA